MEARRHASEDVRAGKDLSMALGLDRRMQELHNSADERNSICQLGWWVG